MSRRFLYRRSGSVVMVILALAGVGLRVGAQEKPQLKRPHDVPEERPVAPPKKKVKGPRAVGIVQFSSNGKTTLFPVAILIEGRFYDASVYKADPVPMALEGGTVYEAEEAGESQGLFTVNGALHSKDAGSANPWMGTGSFLEHGKEAAKSTRRAEDVPVGLDTTSGDEPPRLTRGKGSKAGTTGDSGSAKAGSGSSDKASAPGSEKSGGASGDSSGKDAPKQANPAAADETADQGAKEQSGAGQKSAEQKPSDQQPAEKGESYYRPTLRRGKPTQAAPDEAESEPKVGQGGSQATTSGAVNIAVARLVPAISDAGGPEPQSYKFFWKEGEEDERRKQMIELAGNEVRAYVVGREKGAIPAKPAAKTGASSHKSAGKPAQPVLENIQFRAFDVWKNNQPVMILSAEAHLSPTVGMTAAPEIYSITLVARTDIYGNLRKLYSGVTDKFHLDVTPRLELIDVVDADGDGRGELLFRETTDSGRGYLIYRATGDKLWKMFDSLGE